VRPCDFIRKLRSQVVWSATSSLLLVRLRQPGAAAPAAKVMQSLNETPIETLGGCFAVLTDNKLRIKRR